MGAGWWVINCGLMTQPSERDARHIVEDCLGEHPLRAERFTTGLCHYVFDVLTEEGNQYAVRIATPESGDYLLGGLYWQSRIEDLGVPIPKVLLADTELANPYAVLERLPGTDLGKVYADLSTSEKQQIVRS